ncbi:MAG: hypothetical protein LPL13_10010, partial [Alphaproteobacteria bacterium]|nr:hypothetical protein [Alphaproteobacteria bacterium]
SLAAVAPQASAEIKVALSGPAEAYERIAIRLEGLDPAREYLLTLAAPGSPLNTDNGYTLVKKMAAGETSLHPIGPGTYELRVHAYETGYAQLASIPVTVEGGPPAIAIAPEAPSAGQKLSFEASNLNPRETYRVVVVAEGTSEGSVSRGIGISRKKVQGGALPTLPEGRFVVRLHLAKDDLPVLARHAFEVTPGEPGTPGAAITLTAPDSVLQGERLRAAISGLDPRTQYWLGAVPAAGRGAFQNIGNAESASVDFTLPVGPAEIRLGTYQAGSHVLRSMRVEVFADAAQRQAAAEERTRADAATAGTFLETAYPGAHAALLDAAKDLPMAIPRETVFEGIEQAAAVLFQWKSLGGVWDEIGVTPDMLAEYAAADPEGFLASVTEEVGSGIATSVATEVFSQALADLLFEKGVLKDLPHEWKVPLHAMTAATLAETIGLVRSTGNPTEVVGAVLSRLHDAYKIYKATKALAETQQFGLYSMALGLDIASDLVTAYPTDKALKIVAEERQAMRARLPKVVGADDTRETAAILDMGYEALLAAKRGEAQAARATIARMREAGDAADGYLLSAEGPIDLLLKLASGSDAPGQAVRMLLSATALKDVEGVATSVVGVPAGASCQPVRTAEGCSLCAPEAAGMYAAPPRAGGQVTYTWSGRCKSGSVQGEGTLSVFRDGVDEFEIAAARRTGVRFEAGAPVYVLEPG